MEALLDTDRLRHSTGLEARLAAAHTIALQLGWCLFGGFLRASTGWRISTIARLPVIGNTVNSILTPRGRLARRQSFAIWTTQRSRCISKGSLARIRLCPSRFWAIQLRRFTGKTKGIRSP